MLQVPEPKSHEASVVRCTSCGAPRERGAHRCGHCHADFTLHERDLHTICPSCAARVSDRAKYCHHCGQVLAASEVAGEQSDLGCPACDEAPPLSSRRLGRLDLSMLECQRCAGMWLDNRVFEQLTLRARVDAPTDDVLAAILQSGSEARSEHEAAAGTGRRKWRYRKCPACGKMMQRRNYGHKSGVIIDVCRDDGVWLDADELHRIVTWIRGGGRERALRHLGEAQRAAAHARQVRRAADREVHVSWDDDYSRRDNGFDFVASVIESIFLS